MLGELAHGGNRLVDDHRDRHQRREAGARRAPIGTAVSAGICSITAEAGCAAVPPPARHPAPRRLDDRIQRPHHCGDHRSRPIAPAPTSRTPWCRTPSYPLHLLLVDRTSVQPIPRRSAGHPAVPLLGGRGSNTAGDGLDSPGCSRTSPPNSVNSRVNSRRFGDGIRQRIRPHRAMVAVIPLAHRADQGRFGSLTAANPSTLLTPCARPAGSVPQSGG